MQEDSKKIEIDAKVIIFDKDGTLLSHNHFVPILEKRIELLTGEFKLSTEDQKTLMWITGIDPETHEIIPNGTLYIARVDTQLLIEAFLNEKGFRGSQVRNQVIEIFQRADIEVELEKFIKPLPGVPALLAKLKERGVQLAIATHDNTEAASRQLEVANINQYIDLIIGLDYNESISHKPSPSMLLTACEKFQVTPDETVVVGDSNNDVMMGKNGGAFAIAVLSGEHKAEDFKNYDAILDSVAELTILD
jgi:phosphoglycolate phosphatase